MLQNVAFYREARSISAAQARENKEAIVTGSLRTMGDTISRSLPMLELNFCSFFTLRTWHNMDDCGGGQNTSIKRQMLDKRAKNPTKHIKQLYSSINRE